MQRLFDRQLLVVSGKGGVGKTTIAAALGLAAADAGRRTIVVEVGEESRLPAIFGVQPPAPGIECMLTENLSSISIDPDRALLEWLQVLGGRVSGRLLASSGTFQYFAAAAPGAKELVTMVKIWRLTGEQDHPSSRNPLGAAQTARARARPAGHDLVVLDAPASGHALGLLSSPHTFGAIARVGPIAGQTRKVQELLETRERSAYVAVALGTEMAVTEVLELQEGLHARLGRELEAVVVNALLPQRFTAAELRSMAALTQDAHGRTSGAGGSPGRVSGAGGSPEPTRVSARERQAVREAAVRAAMTVHRRARFQHHQLARLRRQELEVVGIPFVWTAQLDMAALNTIARRLARALQSEASR